MPRITRLPLLALLLLGSGPAPADAAPAGVPSGGLTGRRVPFVIGSPGRLDGDADRREPRLYERADSAVAAYADVEVVQDRTWLRHEVEHYARRALDCEDVGRPWCRREVRQIGAARVIALVDGSRAEVVWVARGNRAVRLGWRRIVETHGGTMTVDVPPQAFAGALLAAFPSQFEAFEFDGARARVFAAEEVDRLMYYVDQVLVGLSAVRDEAPRRHAERFVADAVARIALLRAQPLPAPWAGAMSGVVTSASLPASGVLPPALAEQLEVIRAWRADGAAMPWCAAAAASPVAPELARAWRP